MKNLKKLTILHSNDMHGDFLAEQIDERLVGGVSLLSGYVNKVRRRGYPRPAQRNANAFLPPRKCVPIPCLAHIRQRVVIVHQFLVPVVPRQIECLPSQFVGDFSSPVMLVDGVGAGVEQAVDRVLLVLLLLGNLRLHHIYHTCGCQCFRRIKRLCSFLPLFLSFFTQLLQYTDTLILDGGPELEDKYSIFQQKKFAKIQRIKQFMNGFHILRYMCLYGVICCYFVLSFISYLKIF